jgi:serine/threonine protein kinase
MEQLRENDPFASTLINTDSFKFETVLGRGAFGKVLLVSKRDTGERYAMKVINKTRMTKNKQRLHAMTERNILSKIDNPFIVKLHYAFQTKEKLFLVMDYVRGGELFHLLRKLGRFKEDLARFYAAQVVLALDTIHGHGFIYRDIKPENILIDDDGNTKLVDFNLATLVDDTRLAMTFCGTPEYISPEVLKGEPQTSAVDFWSLGVLIFEMLAGHPPFYSANRQQLFKNILQKPVKMKQHFSEDAVDLLGHLLVVDPRERLTDMLGLKQHSFFAKIDWLSLLSKGIEPPVLPKAAGISNSYLDSSEEEDFTPKEDFGSSERKRNVYEDFTYKNSLT